MTVDVVKRGDIFSGTPDGYSQEDGAMRIPTSERIARLEAEGFSGKEAGAAVVGQGVDESLEAQEQRKRERLARAELGVVQVFESQSSERV